MQSPAQRFFFVVPDDMHTHGGTTFIYRYVSGLAAGGVSAFVMQSSPTHSYPGIEGDVPVVYSDVVRRRLRRWMPRHRVAADVARRLVQGWANSAAAKADLLPGDVLVVPDVFINPVTEAFPDQRIVLLNQSYGILIDQLAAARGFKAYPLTRCVADVATSDASARVPDVLGVRPVHRLPLWIDRSLFAFSGAKKRQIAYMPRRLAEDSREVVELLRRTTDLRGFEIVPIEGRTWKEVADILRESLIFLAFQRDEGFGLPPAEAMACGCIVVGYVGQGAAEYFDHTTGVVVLTEM
jgi:glycosyltransferase involved in cell wall biosynthesis